MTCAACEVGNVGTVGKFARLMDLMTFDTIVKFLVLHMRFVAVQAVRLVTVLVVAKAAVNFCMGARSGINLCNNS